MKKILFSYCNFQYSSYVTMRLSLILLLIYLSVSMFGYALAEMHVRWKEYQNKKCAVTNDSKE